MSILLLRQSENLTLPFQQPTGNPSVPIGLTPKPERNKTDGTGISIAEGKEVNVNMKGTGRKAILIGSVFLVVTLLVAVAAMAAGTKARDRDKTADRVCSQDGSCDSGTCDGDGVCEGDGQGAGGTRGQCSGTSGGTVQSESGQGVAGQGGQVGNGDGDQNRTRQQTRDQDKVCEQYGTCTQATQGADAAQAGTCLRTQERACVRTEEGSDEAQGDAERTRERESLRDCDNATE
jgi:hypothetical protein